MSDFEAIAARLYGGGAPAPEASSMQAEEPAATPLQDAAQANPSAEAEKAASEPPGGSTSSDMPDAIRELRDDPLRRMFSPQGTYAGVQLEAAMDRVTVDPEIKAAAAAEYREIFADMGASPQDAQEIVDAASRFGAEPMTPERDASNANEAIGALNRAFGKDATNALKDAQLMVNRDPRLARVLDQSRLGNDPATVVKLATLARSARMRGELK